MLRRTLVHLMTSVVLAAVGRAQVGPVRIQVSAATATVAAGDTLQCTATKFFLPAPAASGADVTNFVTWVSSNPSVTVNSSGFVTTHTQGSAIITAVSGPFRGSAGITVTAPALVSIDVTAAKSSLLLYATQQYTATGHYTDGSTPDITSQVTWVSTMPNVASISASGLAKASGAGSTQIQASLNSIMGSASLTVTCDGSDGAFAPTSDVVLAPNTYHYTSINIPAGVTVSTTGNAVLQMQSCGDVIIGGTISVSAVAGGSSGSGINGGGAGSPTGMATASVANGTFFSGAGTNAVGGGGGTGSAGQHGGGFRFGQGGSFGGGGGADGGQDFNPGGGGGGGGYGGGAGGFFGADDGCGGSGGAGGGPNGGSGDPCNTAAAGGGAGGAPYDGQSATVGVNIVGAVTGSGGGGSIGAAAAADLAMATTFQPGSGGGGGGSGGDGNGEAASGGGGGGGGGGGAVLISSPTSISITGSILANGGNGGAGGQGLDDANDDSGGGGGGGS